MMVSGEKERKSVDVEMANLLPTDKDDGERSKREKDSSPRPGGISAAGLKGEMALVADRELAKHAMRNAGR